MQAYIGIDFDIANHGILIFCEKILKKEFCNKSIKQKKISFYRIYADYNPRYLIISLIINP